ncbi:hypothetical protein OC835_001420 [Tilletia horrida]|nr:hypothetical protein OC835_001420 [Tilletia horrida]
MCRSFLIAGGGVFGASTAVHLKKRFPDASVRILERSPSTANTTVSPSPDAASSDLNKIIRADYADEAFRRLAVDAIAHWRTDERLRPFYHEVGLLLHSLPYSSSRRDELDAAEKVAERGVAEAQAAADVEGSSNGSDLPAVAFLCNTDQHLQQAIPAPALASAGTALRAIAQDGSEDAEGAAYLNPRAGWAEAKEATSAMLAYAIELGVHVIYGAEVVELLTTTGEGDGQRLACGLKTADGTKQMLDEADEGAIFLCTGSWTPHLLQTLTRNEPALPPITAPPVVFSAQTVLLVEVSEDVALRHANIPVVLNYDTGFYCFEPRKVEGTDGVDRWLVKCAIHDRGYQAPTPPAPAGSKSLPCYPGFDAARPDESRERSVLASSSARKHVPAEHEARMLQALKAVWPEMVEHGTVHESRICWYAETTDENWLIDRHPSLPNLIVASGDSGHGFKFLPTIGELIIARLPAHVQAEPARPIPPLNEHWTRVFSWAHHEERFEAVRQKAQAAGSGTSVANNIEWKPDRDSASKVLKGEGPGLVGAEHDVSRGL